PERHLLADLVAGHGHADAEVVDDELRTRARLTNLFAIHELNELGRIARAEEEALQLTTARLNEHWREALQRALALRGAEELDPLVERLRALRLAPTNGRSPTDEECIVHDTFPFSLRSDLPNVVVEPPPEANGSVIESTRRQ